MLTTPIKHANHTHKTYHFDKKTKKGARTPAPLARREGRTAHDHLLQKVMHDCFAAQKILLPDLSKHSQFLKFDQNKKICIYYGRNTVKTLNSTVKLL